MQHCGKLPELRSVLRPVEGGRACAKEVKHVTQFSRNGTEHGKLLTLKGLTRPISCPTRDANNGVRT